jgi:hypothetical protein
MANSSAEFDSFVASQVEELKTKGLPLHRYQVFMALQLPQFRDAILKKLSEGYALTAVVRVYYSQAPSLLEVLARFTNGKGVLEKSTAILVTLKAAQYEFVSLADNFEEPLELRPEGMTLLPFPMAAPSQNIAIGFATDNSLVASIEARRRLRLNALIGEDGTEKKRPFDSTNCQTGTNSPTMTNKDSTYTTAIPGGGTSTDHMTDQDIDDTQESDYDMNDDQN